MTKQQMLQGTILSNRAIQQQARTLNVRAGEVVFPVWTREEWQSWLAPRLKGAISAETLDVDDILLPQLPADEIQLVMDMNPDTIEILGKEVSVEYREPYYGTPRPPQARLRGEFVSRALWNKLPDEGVKLPGGRTVSVLVISDNGYTLAEGGDIPALKLELKNQLNRAQWNEWTSRPEISVPTEIMDETALPEIITAVYGTCVVTGESLEAFGTLTASRYWSSDPITWKPEWFRVRTEAEAAFSKAQAELEKAKVEAREKREREAVRAEAEAVKSRAKDLYGTYCSYSSEPRIEGDLRDRLYELYYAWIPDTNDQCREWTTKAKAIIAEVEVATSEARRKHEEKLAEDARLQAEAEKQFGNIPENLLSAFSGNKATTFAFMQKVAKLPTKRLDEHVIVSCGRARRRDHLVEVSGDQEFFLGADPNDVSWYVADVHLYRRHTYSESVRTVSAPVPATPQTGSSLDALASKWGARVRK